LQELTLSPSAERFLHCDGWMMARMAEGTGYWLQSGVAHRQLNLGDGLIVLRNASGIVRVSQLGSLKLQRFTVQPQYLNGLLTAVEWQQLEVAPDNLLPSVSFFAADESIGQKFIRLADQTLSDRLSMRCALLLLWANAVSSLCRCRFPRRRHAEFFPEQTPELARSTLCTPRHLSRIFTNRSARPSRTNAELRLTRVRDQLTTCKSKVVEVALESGYESLSLFDLMFTRRFGTSPGRWRRRRRNNGNGKHIRKRAQLLAV
jgi:AraC-like DNA-binding protein